MSIHTRQGVLFIACIGKSKCNRTSKSTWMALMSVVHRRCSSWGVRLLMYQSKRNLQLLRISDLSSSLNGHHDNAHVAP